MLHKSLENHLFLNEKKRILSLDGRGINNIVIFEYLERIETLLQQRYFNDTEFVLSDYFDIIGGVSSSTLISILLSMGLKVKEVRRIFNNLISKINTPDSFFNLFKNRVNIDDLNDYLIDILGNKTIGDSSIRTGLILFLKRIDNNSTWYISNNPKGKFFELDTESNNYPNKKYRLKNIALNAIGGSDYLQPIELMVSNDKKGLFIDSGLSSIYNPSFVILLYCILNDYKLKWNAGHDNLLLVSIGVDIDATLDLSKGNNITTEDFIKMTMGDSNKNTQIIMNWLGKNLANYRVNAEVGSLNNEGIFGNKLLTYIRYSFSTDPSWIENKLNYTIHDESDEQELRKLYTELTTQMVKTEHFPSKFDIIGL